MSLKSARTLSKDYINDIVNELTSIGQNRLINKALEIQRQISEAVLQHPLPGYPRYILGLDCSFPRIRNSEFVLAAGVLWDSRSNKPVQFMHYLDKVTFPYIPGLLAFRELPALLHVYRQCEMEPDLLLVDGQGIAHPRYAGIASHIGVVLNKPSIGCAKSVLYGTYTALPRIRGQIEWLRDKTAGNIIGALLCTRTGTSPLVISIGHKITLEEAICIVLQGTTRYKLPEPLRLAHNYATTLKHTSTKNTLF